jgi:hypothetical protein
MRIRIHTPIFLGLLLLIFSFCRSASAGVINFDDIKRNSDPFWAAHPITDHYQSEGLIIDGGYLNEYWVEDETVLSGPNYLQGGPYLSFSFVGKKPKFVSLVVTSSNKDVVTLGASCGDGSILVAETPGWAGPHNNTPFKANNLITFVSDHGISHIAVSAFYFLRTSAMIDDITFYYELPEPAPMVLLALGLMALILARSRFSPNSNNKI